LQAIAHLQATVEVHRAAGAFGEWAATHCAIAAACAAATAPRQQARAVPPCAPAAAASPPTPLLPPPLCTYRFLGERCVRFVPGEGCASDLYRGARGLPRSLPQPLTRPCRAGGILRTDALSRGAEGLHARDSPARARACPRTHGRCLRVACGDAGASKRFSITFILILLIFHGPPPLPSAPLHVSGRCRETCVSVCRSWARRRRLCASGCRSTSARCTTMALRSRRPLPFPPFTPPAPSTAIFILPLSFAAFRHLALSSPVQRIQGTLGRGV
jgi:hypothetical protein